MSSVTTSRATQDSGRIAVAARAGIAGVLALAITFNPDHGATWGLVALGGFAILQAVLDAIAIRALPTTPGGRAMAVARVALGGIAGVLAVAFMGAGTPALVIIGAVLFIGTGLLWLLGTLLHGDRSRFRREHAVVGIFSIVLGLVYLVFPRDSLLLVGLLGAWGAIVAVYLGIAAAGTGAAATAARPEPREAHR